MKRFLQFGSLLILFMFAFELSRLYFIFYNARFSEAPLLTVFAMTAIKGFFMDLSASGYCIAPLLLLFLVQDSFKLKLKDYIFKFIIIIGLLMIGLITVADPELYVQWGGKFNNQVLVYITHPVEMAISSGAINAWKTLLFALVLGLSYWWIGTMLLKVCRREINPSVQHTIADLLQSVLLFVMIRGGVGVTTMSQSSAIFSSNRFYNSAAVNSLWNALYYIIYDTDSLYDQTYFPYPEAEAKKLSAESISGSSMNPDLTSLQNPNIMIVVLESFTASGSRFFSSYNNCMPGLDSIAKQSLSFTSCYASGDRTEKGLVAILSAYPAQPASSVIVFPNKSQKLAAIGSELKKLGYTNAFYYGGDADFASMKAYMLMHGTDRIVDRKSFSKEEQNSKWGAHDGNLYKKVLSEHRAVREPFFTTILSLSSHEPYEVPYEAADLVKDEWYKYKNSLRYADHVLYEFLKECSKQAWYKNTLIVLVADHGHDIGLKDKHFFGKEKYHIPLVITGGALRPDLKGMSLTNPVSQTLIPSLLLGSFTKVVADFNWQSGALDSTGFAQYHYNSGFGRVKKGSECVYDNLEKTYYFKGLKEDSSSMQKLGRMYQQVLIRDFLKK